MITYPNRDNLSDSELAYQVLDFVLAEQMDGRRPTIGDVAHKFGMSPSVAEQLHASLKASGEL